MTSRLVRWILAVGLVASAAGCTPRSVAETFVLDDTVIRTAGLAYGEDPRQSLDVYRAKTTRRGAPVVIFIYGGRWKYSSKHDYLLVGNALARQGWVAVVANYRLFPEARFPAWVVDGASTIRWTRDHIAPYGGDSTNIVVVGHSSGAHTVTMLALDDRYLRAAGVPAGAVRGFVSMAGPVDTTWTDADVQEMMGPRDQWRATYPSTFVDGRNPPLLLLHGTTDDIVKPGNSVRLAARIRARGGCARLGLYKGIGHVKIALAIVSPSIAPVLRDIIAFVHDPAGYACPHQ
ncbi:MAG: alpha/beta hydrolase [bacterium]